MSHNILLTGASGYLGGSILARLQNTSLPPYSTLYALVRTPEQAEAVKKYNATPLQISLDDADAISTAIIDKEISIIFFLVDAGSSKYQPSMIKALAEVKRRTQRDVHFLHTSGAKAFSSHAGHPTDRPLLDSDERIHEVHKGARADLVPMQQAVNTNLAVIDLAKEYGVRSYIFVPCIVYGKGLGFGKKTSIQTAAIVSAAVKLRRVYDPNPGTPSWPVCHIEDNTSLYIAILGKLLLNESIDEGENGFYLAAFGSVPWTSIYAAMAEHLAKRNAIDDADVRKADDAVLAKMGEALGVPEAFVNVSLGGSCSFTARHGKSLGWVPKYAPEHILEAADEEVEILLEEISAAAAKI